MDSKNIEHEQLFWKVIHNKYIFNLIFEKIHEISNEIELTHNIKSYKFKDIESLSWMIEFGALNILKYKLSNYEKIRINEDGLNNLVNSIIKNEYNLQQLKCGIYDKLDSGGIQTQKNKNTNQGFEERINKIKYLLELYYEILMLILKNYKFDILHFNIITSILENSVLEMNHYLISFEVIKKLLSEPFTVILTPYHFKLVILNYNVDFIKKFIEVANQFNCSIVDQNFKEQSLLIVLNKKIGSGKNKRLSVDQDVLEFILDNPQYYSQSYSPKFTPKPLYFLSEPSCIGKKIGYFQYDVQYDKDDGDIKSFFNLNENLQIKLLSLKFYNNSSIHYNEIKEFLYELHWLSKKEQNDDSINRISRLHNKYSKYIIERDQINQFIYDINYNSDHLDPPSKIKSIYRFFSFKYSHVYAQYLIRYQELLFDDTIQKYLSIENTLDLLIESLKQSYSLNLLKFILVNSHNIAFKYIKQLQQYIDNNRHNINNMDELLKLLPCIEE